MKKKNIFTAAVMAGATAIAGAAIYKLNKDRKVFSKEKWDEDISNRYLMADNLVRTNTLIGLSRSEVI